LVAFAVEADKVRRQESPDFVFEKIAIQSPGEPKAHLLASGAPVFFPAASGEALSLLACWLNSAKARKHPTKAKSRVDSVALNR
jgi:hypothetical protein